MLALDDLLRDRLGIPSPLESRAVLTVASPFLGEVELLCTRFALDVDRLCVGRTWSSIRVRGPRHIVAAVDDLARNHRGLPIMSPWA